MNELREDDVVLCEVKKIEGTSIFLEVEGGFTGTMILSEVAAGRIRNLRDYVTIGKKIVCKILKINGDNIELSLRRVTAKERAMVLERYKKERALANILRLAGENAEDVIRKIKQEQDLLDFFQNVKKNPKILEKYIPKEKVERIANAVAEKVEKEKKVVRKISLKSFSEIGLDDLKSILDFKNIEIRYLGNSQFSIIILGNDFRELNHKMQAVLDEIQKRAKERKAEFEILKE